MLQVGDKGEAVKVLQEKLIARGYDLGQAGADGDFGKATYNAVIKFQSDNGLEVDGIVGQETENALNRTYTNEILKLGSKGEAVTGLQQLLIAKGYSVGSAGADGDFGQATKSAVIKFQSDNGLEVDGVVGIQTWNALYGVSNDTPPVSGSVGIKKFLSIARAELGYKEGDENITQYGEWYGDNGQPWCAMFVSWCASQAGILGDIIPRYEGCEAGSDWYKNKGRYRTRTSGYIPVIGDIIFFKNSDGFYFHTGIVESVSGGNVNTIEGNCNDSVCRQCHSVDEGTIDGYGVNS